MSDQSISDRQSLEHLWRSRLNDAKSHLQFAQNRVDEFERDLPAASPAYEQALRAERSALLEYRRVLRILDDLMVHGKVSR